MFGGGFFPRFWRVYVDVEYSTLKTKKNVLLMQSIIESDISFTTGSWFNTFIVVKQSMGLPTFSKGCCFIALPMRQLPNRFHIT